MNCSASAPLNCKNKVIPSQAELNWATISSGTSKRLWIFCTSPCAFNLAVWTPTAVVFKSRNADAFQADLTNSKFRLAIVVKNMPFNKTQVFYTKPHGIAMISPSSHQPVPSKVFQGSGVAKNNHNPQQPSAANPLAQPLPVYGPDECHICKVKLPLSWRQQVSGIRCGPCKIKDITAMWAPYRHGGSGATVASHGMSVSVGKTVTLDIETIAPAVNDSGSACKCDMTNGLSGCYCGAFQREQKQKPCTKCGRKGG